MEHLADAVTAVGIVWALAWVIVEFFRAMTK